MDRRTKYILGLALLATALIAPMVANAQSVTLSLKVYTKNILGWEATSVTVTAYAVFATPYTFDTDLSYVKHEAVAVWWCLTCFASVDKSNKVVNSTTVREDAKWTQGSWNMKISGETHLMIKVYGSYTVKELAYYDISSTTITVIDAIKSAINDIVDIFSKLL